MKCYLYSSHYLLIFVLFLSMVLYSMSTQDVDPDKSVQIFGVDESDTNNPKLVPNWVAIDQIFRTNIDIKSKPLKVLVVCGEPRLGKSTFCSLLYNNNPDCINVDYDQDSNTISTNKDVRRLGEGDQIKKIFDTADNSFRTKTKGVWITPKPITVKNKSDDEILFNLFIVDVEGILGLNSDKLIYQQLFVLSSMMSSHFVYYLRHPFNEYNQYILQLYAALTKKANNKNQDLILLISNVKNNKEFNYGFKSSDEYILTLDHEVQLNLKIFNKYFERVRCFLMPEPADPMRKGSLNDSDPEYNISDIGEEYMEYLLDFRKMLTSTMGGIKTSENIKNLNGEKYADLLEFAYNLISSGKLEKIPNLFRITANDMNGKEIKRIIGEYENEMKSYYNDFITNIIKLHDLKINNTNIINKWLDVFCNSSFYDWMGTDSRDFKQELQNKMKQTFDDFVENSKQHLYCLNNYITGLTEFLKVQEFSEGINDNAAIEMKHKELSSRLLKIFDENCKNKGESSGHNFKNILVEAFDKNFEIVKTNVIQLKSKLREHKEKIKKHYSSIPWYNTFFKSNSWIKANNKHLNKIYPEFRNNINNNLKGAGLDLEQIFLHKTNENFQEHYNNERSWENVKIWGTSIVAGITTGVVAAVPIALTATDIVATGGAATLVIAFGTFVAREYLKSSVQEGSE